MPPTRRIGRLSHDKYTALMLEYAKTTLLKPQFDPKMEVDVQIESFFSVVRLSEHWRYLPEILMLRHDCKGDGKFVRAGTRTKPPYTCAFCNVDLPEHLQLVIRVWASD